MTDKENEAIRTLARGIFERVFNGDDVSNEELAARVTEHYNERVTLISDEFMRMVSAKSDNSGELN